MKLEQVLKNAVGKNHPLGVKLRVLSLKGNKMQYWVRSYLQFSQEEWLP